MNIINVVLISDSEVVSVQSFKEEDVTKAEGVFLTEARAVGLTEEYEQDALDEGFFSDEFGTLTVSLVHTTI